jgi:hypothetical protein
LSSLKTARKTFSQTLVARLRWLFTEPVTKPYDPRTILWLALALASSILFARLALQEALAGNYVTQDDGRQHIFWAARFVDPGLFPGDLIADYFQSIAPAGYRAVYKSAAALGLDPSLFSKLLPAALGLATTLFCFAASMRLIPVPGAAFIGSLVLNESLWLRKGLVSATPRAFAPPLFMAFVYFLLRGSTAGALITIALMGLFFPSIALIALGVYMLRVVRVEKWRLKFSRERRDWTLSAAALCVAAVALLPYAIDSSSFGPVVTANEARAMPEFLPKGRMVVFRQGFIDYWFTGSHTGMFSSSLFSPLAMAAGLLLPILFLFPRRMPLVKNISTGISLIPKIVIVSIGLFIAANLLLFRLYLPSRFTAISFRLLLALAAGISIVIVLDAALRWAGENSSSFARLAATIILFGILGGSLVLPQITDGTWVNTGYKTGQSPKLYEFISSQPKDTLIASLSKESDNLPTFTGRRVLVGKETALPFHKGYYDQIRRRAIDLIEAQYSPDIAELQNFIRRYNVNFLLVDGDAFTTEYVARNDWMMQYQPAATNAIAGLNQGAIPALARLSKKCSVLEVDGMALISAECLLRATEEDVTQLRAKVY